MVDEFKWFNFAHLLATFPPIKPRYVNLSSYYLHLIFRQRAASIHCLFKEYSLGSTHCLLNHSVNIGENRLVIGESKRLLLKYCLDSVLHSSCYLDGLKNVRAEFLGTLSTFLPPGRCSGETLSTLLWKCKPSNDSNFVIYFWIIFQCFIKMK